MRQARVNEGYELYQIITDFGDPLEIFREALQNSFDADATQIYVNVLEKRTLAGEKLIIEITDNGHGLSQDYINAFFDVANSTKVDDDYNPVGNKHGYKGHGAKVFFNAEKVIICSKTKNGEYWASLLDAPLDQIATKKYLEYTDPEDPSKYSISLPDLWDSGFKIQIVAPRHFLTQHTHSQLNHKFLRDYCKWYTIFGTVETKYNDELKNKDIKLFLSGLNIDNFKQNYNSKEKCDPIPEIINVDLFKSDFEQISLGHYFPKDMYLDSDLKNYTKVIGSNKNWYEYYSKVIYNKEVISGGISFRLIIGIEGYEAKRRYDLLLSKRKGTKEDGMHTDGSRYGLWACKGGVPVEKIDD